MIKVFLALRGNLEVCGEASDGVEAIKKAGEFKPDLILLDLVMPNMNGAEAASVLRTRMPETAIILFTIQRNVGQYL